MVGKTANLVMIRAIRGVSRPLLSYEWNDLGTWFLVE